MAFSDSLRDRYRSASSRRSAWRSTGAPLQEAFTGSQNRLELAGSHHQFLRSAVERGDRQPPSALAKVRQLPA
jgi:hypothetical protein